MAESKQRQKYYNIITVFRYVKNIDCCLRYHRGSWCQYNNYCYNISEGGSNSAISNKLKFQFYSPSFFLKFEVWIAESAFSSVIRLASGLSFLLVQLPFINLISSNIHYSFKPLNAANSVLHFAFRTSFRFTLSELCRQSIINSKLN